MPIRIAPPCKLCGMPYLHGMVGICNSCHTRRRRGVTGEPGRSHRLKCYCDRPAVSVILVDVGYEFIYTVPMPVCQDCLQIEIEDEGEPVPDCQAAPMRVGFQSINLDIKPRDRFIEYIGWHKK